MLKANIDTRLCPFDAPPRVSLYSNSPIVAASTKVDQKSLEWSLQQTIAPFFGVDASQVVLAASGCAALIAFLVDMTLCKQRALRVALPSYSCGELGAALIQTQSHPILLDLTDELSISEQSIEFAAMNCADLLIWPNLFQPRHRELSALMLCQDLNIPLVLDEAQSFPGAGNYQSELCNSVGAIVSFGRSKRSAGSGGGAFIAKDPLLAQRLNRQLNATPLNQNHNGPLPQQRMYSRLDELVAARGIPQVPVRPISRVSAECATEYLSRIEKYESRLITNCAILKDAITYRSENCLIPIAPGDVSPSIFSCRVPAEKRYGVLDSLRKAKIQSTWYYWPLHLYAEFASAPCEQMINTERLAGEIVILPCQYHHSEGEMRLVSQELRQCQH